MLDEEIKKSLKKCSRCALCSANCPIYDIKKDENNTSRGLICKLLGYEKEELSLKEIKKDLKICLNCSKCRENCPAKIDTIGIFAYKNANFFPSKINQKLFLNLKLLPIKLLYFLNFFKPKKKNKLQSNVVYFKGCIAKAQHKTTYLDSLFYTPDFSCCGLPYLTSGDMAQYQKSKEKNIDLIKNSQLVIFDCASCKSAVEEYFDEKEQEKFIFFTDLIKNKKLKLKENSKYKNKTITFHKPCHMTKKDFETIENILSSIDEINYKKLENPDSCCGFGGSYFIFHPIISSLIALKKAKTIKKTSADLILSACPSCVLGLRYGQLISFNFKKTLELRDFINQEIVIGWYSAW